MFVTSTTTVGVSQRVVATLVACAVVLTSIGFYNTVQAANLTNVSNTLSTSEPSVDASHTINFTVPTGSSIASGNNIVITFDSRDDGSPGQDFNAGDISAAVGDASNLTIEVNGGGTSTPTFVSSDNDSFTISGVTASAGQEVEIVVAEAAGLTNPAKVNGAGVGDSYEIEIDVANATSDLGRTRVAIIDTVEVTAIVPTQFEFEIRPVATSTTVNGEATTGGSSSTTIPFGELVADTAEFIAQQLSVTTNARNGFIVTVEQSGPLLSSTGADIDNFIDGGTTTLPTAWDTPDGTLAFGEDGWGHWGMTTEDGDVFSAGAPDFGGSDEYIAVLDTPQVVFGHDGPSDGTTTGAGTSADDDIGVTEVGYKIEITSLQEAGDDYNTTLTYIATPTF